MIPESEWRPCQAPGCDKLIKPHSKEGRGQYALRKYCDRKCRGVIGFVSVPLRECANPKCQNLVPRDPGMKPVDYARRKACSLECARRVMSISARLRHEGLPKAPTRRRCALRIKDADGNAATRGNYHIDVGVKVKKRKRLEAPRLANEADAVAAFIAQHGITYCPPKYAAPTLNAALPERDAKRVLRRLQIADHRYASWSWRPQT